MNRTNVLLSLLILALLLAGASCGGTNTATPADSNKGAQGITQGGFNLVRYDDQGTATDALNPTLNLKVSPDGATTTVTIAIDDKQPTQGVTLDLHYDASHFSPQDVHFNSLIDTPIQMAVTKVNGLVALGQVSTNGATSVNGQFATVTFRNQPNRAISAANDASNRPINSTYSAGGFSANGFTATGNSGTIDYNILGIFTSLNGDGDQNGASNIADLTPLGALFQHAVSATDAGSARADYDGNGIPNISDLTPLGAHFGEVTTGIDILLGDDDQNLSSVASLTWASGENPITSGTLTDPNDIWKQWSGNLDASIITAADTNADGHVFISARATTSAGGANGPAFPAIDIDTGGGSGNPSFNITSVDFQVGGTTIHNGDILNLLTSNQDITLEATRFDGTFNGSSFDPQALDTTTTPTEQQYQDELAALQADAEYTQTLSADPTFHTDKPGVLLNIVKAPNTSGPPQPDTATVFPDDDPGNSAEGTLTVTFSNSNNAITPITVVLDVQPDGLAPLVDDIRTGGGQDGNNNWLVTNTDPTLRGHLTFPGGDPTPVDGTTVDAVLVDLTAKAEVLDFTFTAGLPTKAGDFTLTASLTTGWDFIAQVGSGTCVPGHLYQIRFSSPPGAHFSTVNQPGEFFTGATVSTNFSSNILPSNTLRSDDNTIAIIAADPYIRRNPQVDVNVVNGTSQFHYGGFDDKLKANGDEFAPSASNQVPYPQVVVQAGSDPNAIQADAVPSGGENVPQVETSANRIVLDITNLTHPQAPDPAVSYSYKVFGPPAVSSDLSSRAVLTTGTFTINPGPDPNRAPLVGTDFGVNIYDSIANGEGGNTLGNEDFSKKSVSLGTLPSSFGASGSAVDVLFLQFNGGSVLPDGNDNTDGFSDSSNQLVLHDTGLAGDMSKQIDVRVSGVGTNNLDYIGIVHLLSTDAFPVGNLVAGDTYQVQLNDPGNGPSTDFDFGASNLLTVTN